jgi:hypothetical protein
VRRSPEEGEVGVYFKRCEQDCLDFSSERTLKCTAPPNKTASPPLRIGRDRNPPVPEVRAQIYTIHSYRCQGVRGKNPRSMPGIKKMGAGLIFCPCSPLLMRLVNSVTEKSGQSRFYFYQSWMMRRPPSSAAM